MKDKRWFFIVNATAGRGKTGKKIDKIINSLNSHNVDFEIELTKAPKHATQLTIDAINNSFHNIIAVGGDGTLNEVVNGIMKSGKSEEITLGLIPEGGGNDFANNFSFSQKVDKAITRLLAYNTKKIDIGKIEDNYFINALGIGFDAKVAVVSKGIKYLNGLPRYLVAVLKSLVTYRGFNAEIILDDKTFNKPFLLMSIGNGKTTGGGFYLTPEAKIDDGLFNTCFIEDLAKMRILKLLPSAIKGKHLREPEVFMKQTKSIEVKAKTPLPIYFDGELPELKNPLNFKIEIMPNAIKLIC